MIEEKERNICRRVRSAVTKGSRDTVRCGRSFGKIFTTDNTVLPLIINLFMADLALGTRA